MKNSTSKIFLITDSLGLNGWGEYTKAHIEILLRDHNLSIFIFYKLTNTFRNEIFLKNKNRLFFYKISGFYFIDYIYIRVCSILYKPMICHFMSEPISRYISALPNNTKIIQTIHGTYGDLFLNKYKNLLYKIDCFIFVSSFTRNFFNLPVNYNKQKIIFPFSTTLLKIENKFYPIDYKKSNQLIFIGNSKYRKGLYLVLKMFDSLKIEFPNLKLVIIGKINNEHIALINKKSGICNYINVSDLDLIKFIITSKVNLLPSKNVFIEGRLHFEGFGLVHLESIKLGTPSIGCLNTGNESFISDDINGCLINQDDLSGLITATRKLLLLTDKKDFNINVKESVKSFNSEFYRNEIKKIYGI